MSFKSKVFAAAVTVTVVGGVGTVGMLSAGAATPSCGHSCIDIFSRQFGTHRTPNFVVDVFQQGARVGQPIILFRTSNSDPAEDFTVSFQGLTSDFFAAGLVSAAVNLHYGNGSVAAVDEPAFELEYSPFGVGSGLCVGTATTAIQGEGVTLQPCGVSAKTVWILDTFDQPFTFFFRGEAPAINGSDTPRRGPGHQRLGHELQPPVRAHLPEQRLPDRQAAAAAAGPQPDRLLQRLRPDRRHRDRHPAVGR